MKKRGKNIINNNTNKYKKKEFFDITSKALLVICNILTDYNFLNGCVYINVFVANNSAEHAPEALFVMQRSDELRPDGLLGLTPGWRDSAHFKSIKNKEADNK